MLKLRFSKPSVKMYKDGEICVCVYKCTIIDVSDKSIVDSFSVSGTAKLAEGDAMTDLGIKLADSRAKLAAYKRAAHIISDETYDEFAEKIDAMVKVCEFSDFMHYLKRKELKHIKKLRE